MIGTSIVGMWAETIWCTIVVVATVSVTVVTSTSRWGLQKPDKKVGGIEPGEVEKWMVTVEDAPEREGSISLVI